MLALNTFYSLCAVAAHCKSVGCRTVVMFSATQLNTNCYLATDGALGCHCKAAFTAEGKYSVALRFASGVLSIGNAMP